MSRVYQIDPAIFDHPLFKQEPFTEREAWIWMIGEAAWEPTKVRVNRAVFAVERGQFVHALRFLAKRWQWSEARVRRFLERLKLDRMIDALACAEATRITICKYDDYQFGRRARDALTDAPATHSRRREEELEESKNPGGSNARARERRQLISEEAHAFADELAKLCGQDLQFLAPQWISAQPAMRVQMMLDQGWNLEAMRETAKAIVARKRQRGEDPPENIRYFEKAFARAQAPQLPLPSVQIVKESPHAQTVSDSDRRTPWQRDRDANRAAREALRASVERDQSGEGGGEPHLRVVPDANRR